MTPIKTEIGQRVLKDRSVPLTPRQRAAFILFDGRTSVDQVLAATASVGVTRDDVEHLLQVGLLEVPARTAGAPVAAPVAAAPAASAPASGRTAQQRYQEAYPVATRLTAALGLRGFRLNLAVERAADLDDLRELAPRIREAVGDEAFADLDQALNG